MLLGPPKKRGTFGTPLQPGISSNHRSGRLRFGGIEDAWDEAFDLAGEGAVNFTQRLGLWADGGWLVGSLGGVGRVGYWAVLGRFGKKEKTKSGAKGKSECIYIMRSYFYTYIDVNMLLW